MIADVVGGPLETAINGVDNMMYMSSTSSNAGQYSLSVTFEVGTDPDTAQVNVQNRAQLAISQLPAAVAAAGRFGAVPLAGLRHGDRLLFARRQSDALEITNFVTTGDRRRDIARVRASARRRSSAARNIRCACG